MNYMKILLIYMAAAMSLAVQSTTAPTETPVPTPTAAAEHQTEETAAPVQDGTVTAVITETPAAPSETPPPVPEITPNKKYHNLKKGDKGREVKALQERLIELGYLPEGAADGNYGNQTYRAVRNFQYYNGLSRDGIAGKRTQTYLFENPDVNPYPKNTPTPSAPAEITPVPSEKAAPEEIPEAIPAESPTEKPTPKMTEAATETPAAETPAETPAGAPTAAPAETSTETPAATPSETPAPTPDRTAGTPVTSAPVTDAPVEKPTMAVEEIDPDDLHFTEASGSIAFNENSAPLSWMAMEDGVQVLRKPRLQQREGRIRVSLDDLAECLEKWTLSAEENNVVLETGLHTLALLNEEAGIVMTVDGIEQSAEPSDFDFDDGHFINAEFLAKALGGEAEWVEEENTLILRVPERK